MPLTVPAGIVLGNADSYITIAYADSYHDAFGRTDWVNADDERKEWLLKRSSMMIDARYTWVDPLEFLTVPRPVQLSTAELAFHYLENPPAVAPGVKSVQVGAIQVEFESASAALVANARAGIWGFIDMVLSGLATVPSATEGASTASVITVERA